MKNKYFDRMDYIAARLDDAKVPNTFHELYEGYQIRFPWSEGDVACHDGTYGANDGMVETYQFPWDEDDVTVLTPAECAERIIELYTVGP